MSSYKEFYSSVANNLEYTVNKANHSSVFKPKESALGIDMHIHGKCSTDGYMEFADIINRCSQNNVEYISITDHNSFDAIKKLRQQEAIKAHPTYMEYDGVKIFTGVEVSCQMHLSRQDHLSVHMLCYGFDIEKDNILLHILSAKDKDYTMVRFYPLYYLISKNPIYATSLTEFKEFIKTLEFDHSFSGNLNYDTTIDFYKWKGIPEEQIKQDLQGFDFSNPMRDNIQLDVVDIINATHASGGYCVVAHPIKSFEKHRYAFQKHVPQHEYYSTLMDKLIEIGCDGVEYSNIADESSYHFNKEYSKTFITSCGSDTHSINQNNDIGNYSKSIDGLNVSVINKLLELDKAKEHNEQTKRQKQLKQIDNQSTYISFDR